MWVGAILIVSTISLFAAVLSGPSSVTSNAVPRFNNNKQLLNSGVIIDDSDNISGINDLDLAGALTANSLTSDTFISTNVYSQNAIITNLFTILTNVPSLGTDGNGQMIENYDGSGFTNQIRTIGISFDGGGSAITTGIKGSITIPYACAVTEATFTALNSGSIVIDIWSDSYANYPPTDADSITASAPPTITTSTKSQDSTLTGWTQEIPAGNIIYFNVDSCTDITNATLVLKVVTE